MLNQFFKLREKPTDVRTEIRAGLTTFVPGNPGLSVKTVPSPTQSRP